MNPAPPLSPKAWIRTIPAGAGAFLLGAVLFLLDSFTLTDGAASILYVALLVLPAGRWQRRGVIALAGLCVVMTAATYVIAHGLTPLGDPIFRRAVSMVAIGAATLLVLRSLSESNAVDEQARLLDLTDDAILVRDRAGIITYWNRGAEVLYGWSSAEAVGQSARTLLKTALPLPLAAIEAVMAERGRWEGELVDTTRSGAHLVVASRWQPQLNERGERVGTLETSSDVTQRRQADHELRRSEERYRAIFQTVGVAIWEEDYAAVMRRIDALLADGITDFADYFATHPDFVRSCVQDVRVVDVNESAMRMFEADSKADLLESLERVYLPNSTGSFAHILVALAEGAPSIVVETAVRTLRDRPLTVLASMTFPADGGRASPVLVSIMDVTERRRAEADLTRAEESLARVTRISTLGELTAAIAHEVNQPLAAIITNAEASLRWLHRPVPDAMEAGEAIERVIRDGVRATEVVARVRAFLGHTAFNPAPFPLREVMEEACLLACREIEHHDVALRLDLEPVLPPVMGDRIQIEQVIINLLVNGIQAMDGVPTGSRVLRLLAARHGVMHVLVQVQDNGAGITPSAMEHLFRPFFTTKPDGMGMGLSICRSIVDAHGGQIWASSPPGGGAVVQFTLPVAGMA